MIKALCVIGTRPEAIKMIPVIQALRRLPEFNCRVIATAQHREMLDQVLNQFNIKADIDLNIMQPNQSLNEVTARLLLGLESVFQSEKPELVLAQGDTTTVFASALTAFHQRILFGHVEAGLRSHHSDPFPEEMNRVMTSKLTKWHFAPTELSRQNLLQESIDENHIHLTGNTIVDMLRLNSALAVTPSIPLNPLKRLILVTAHRRENFGEPIREIYKAIRTLADMHDDIHFVYPVHPNPNIAPVANAMLSNHPRITLCNALDYHSFLSLMNKAYLILSDSGGIQEESITLKKPLILLREKTERPEGVELGGVILTGHHYDAIIENTQRLLNDEKAYQKASTCLSPYGDGFAADKIAAILSNHFQ